MDLSRRAERAASLLTSLVMIDNHSITLERVVRPMQSKPGLGDKDTFSQKVQRQDQVRVAIEPICRHVREALDASLGIAQCLEGYNEQPGMWEVGLRGKLRSLSEMLSFLPQSSESDHEWLIINSLCVEIAAWGHQLQVIVEALDERIAAQMEKQASPVVAASSDATGDGLKDANSQKQRSLVTELHRPARWFSDATGKGLTEDLLKQWRKRTKRPGSVKSDTGRWFYLVSEVAQDYPVYAQSLMDAMNEASDFRTKRKSER